MATRRSVSGQASKQAPAKRKTKNTSAMSTSSRVEEGVPPPDDTDALHARIALRAYALYEERGCWQGCDLQDWLEAKRQVLEEQRP